MKNNKKKLIILFSLCLVLGLMIVGSYALLKKFSQDRKNAVKFTPPKPQILRQNPNQPRREVTRYNAEDLEKARKEGKLPANVTQPPVPAVNHSQDATQRSLRTLEEINRINEMNRRLMDQQRRMQNQTR